MAQDVMIHVETSSKCVAQKKRDQYVCCIMVAQLQYICNNTMVRSNFGLFTNTIIYIGGYYSFFIENL